MRSTRQYCTGRLILAAQQQRSAVYLACIYHKCQSLRYFHKDEKKGVTPFQTSNKIRHTRTAASN